jgi:hypothetical protein
MTTCVRHYVTLVQDLYIIQINGFSAFMDDLHKMIAGRQLRGTPQEVEGLLVEAIGLIVNDHRHRPENLPALIAQTESFPFKTEGCFTPNTPRDMAADTVQSLLIKPDYNIIALLWLHSNQSLS